LGSRVGLCRRNVVGVRVDVGGVLDPVVGSKRPYSRLMPSCIHEAGGNSGKIPLLPLEVFKIHQVVDNTWIATAITKTSTAVCSVRRQRS
jgi:hypothetical protein